MIHMKHKSHLAPVAQPQSIPAENKKQDKTDLTTYLHGVGAAPGIAIGPIFQFQRMEVAIRRSI